MTDEGFQRKSLLRRLRMPLAEIEAYYRDKREYDYKQDNTVHGIGWRKRLHGFVLAVLKWNSLSIGHRITVLNDRVGKTDRPAIYACTHVGRFDIETALQIIPGQCWFFMGDPGPVYKNVDGLLLWLNGTIFTDTAFKNDRHIGKENCVKVLVQGGSLLIYPEGAWNITENLPVMKLFDGTAEIALRTGSDIVPIAIEKYGKHYIANIGENISCAQYSLTDKKRLTAALRDALAALKWEIWETQGVFSRSELPPDAARQYLEEVMRETENGYTVGEIERTRYHDKAVTSPEEAFAYLSSLVPSRENAFLLRGIRGKYEQQGGLNLAHRGFLG